MRRISDEVLIHAVIYLKRWEDLPEQRRKALGEQRRKALNKKRWDALDEQLWQDLNDGLSWNNVYQRLAVTISVAEKFHGDGRDRKHNTRYCKFCWILKEDFHRIERTFLVQMDFNLYVTPEEVCQMIHYSLHSVKYDLIIHYF